MNNNVYAIEDFNREYKKRIRKEKIHNKLNTVKTWVSNNKELIIVLGPVVISGIIAVVKGISKHHNLEKEKDLKDLYCYDRSLGHYWALKRELTNSEWVEVDQRKNNGEHLGDILNDMNVLK